ncbi:APH/ChoK domain-containing protein [Candidatus Bealeia paramacronuclearis]|uniref:APH/ChoK domain-containing protein n=2 Tax=Candidatus Bealeia paramacronuclearis TaxID=1921001 RepID=A0ABZ2C2T7_9PROT|nr:APH/ChoK domain-containing protein [Candidatus Bealeia paramacronuclearis]
MRLDHFYSVLKFVFFLSAGLQGNAIANPVSLETFRGEHIVSIDFNAQKAWAKRPDPSKSGLKGCLKKALVDLIPIPFFRPTFSCSPAQTLKAEVDRIHHLHAQDVFVPNILEKTSQWIVLSDLGPTLDSLMALASLEDKKKLGIQAAGALAALHQKGQWHGRGEIRDMTLTTSREIGFIDFEENPNGPLSVKQARDFLLFLFSLSEFFEDPQDMVAIVQNYKNQGPRWSYRIARVIFQIVSPFVKVLKIVPLGRDGVRLLKAITLIESTLKVIECPKNPS